MYPSRLYPRFNSHQKLAFPKLPDTWFQWVETCIQGLLPQCGSKGPYLSEVPCHKKTMNIHAFIFLVVVIVIVGQSGLGSVCQCKIVFVIVQSLFCKIYIYIFVVYTFVSSNFKTWFRSCVHLVHQLKQLFKIFNKHLEKKISRSATGWRE